MDKNAFRTRLKRVRDGITRSKVDCLIVTKPANVTYITGFSGDDSWAIVSHTAVTLVTDSRFTEQAAGQCRFCRITRRIGAMTEAVAMLLQKRRKIKLAAVENSTSVADFKGLKKRLSCRLKTAAGIIESARRTKDAGEIAAIRAAAKIARRAFETATRRIRPGLSENEVAGIVDFQIRKFGGQNSFETIVAFGANASQPHHQPTGRKLRRNDTVLIDFGVRLNSYCCDLTRCFYLGRPAPLYNKAYAAVEHAVAAALKMLRAGVNIQQIDAAAKQAIKNAGLPVYGHGTGHGLGLQVHELPAVSNRAQGTLQAGDVITIEPGVYIPGRLGVRIEDDFLVTENGYYALSRSSQR